MMLVFHSSIWLQEDCCLTYSHRSTVINYLEESTKKDEVAIAYVYCDYKDKRTLSETNIWASVVRQLVEACSQLPPDIISFRDKYLEKRALPSDEERISLITALSKRFRKTFILIDALVMISPLLLLNRH